MLLSVLDTETTGLDCSKHEIIQLGIIEYKICDDGSLEMLWESEYKITPQNIETANPNALKINGYNPAHWRESVSFASVQPILDRLWTSSDALLGQNLIFDLRFISKEYLRLGIKPPTFPKYLDTKHMGGYLVNEGILKSSSMDSMCKHFDIRFKGRAHTALTDCQRTVTLWERLQKYAPQQFFTYEEPYDPHANKNARKLNG